MTRSGSWRTCFSARFGGGPTDYQLVEEETAEGLPRVRILVHPAVGALDVAAVAATFLDALARGSPTERVMVEAMATGRAPAGRATPAARERRGKILHLVAAPRSQS